MQIKSRLHLAVDDIWNGVSAIHIWPLLGWQEVKQRYQRSVLGPFWLTISTAIMVCTMGPLYAKLFHQEMGEYFLQLSVSMVVWQFIAQFVAEAGNIFISAEGFIKQIKLPLTIHVMKAVWKNMVIFFHNLVVVALVLAYFRPALGYHVLLFPLALFVLMINAVSSGIVLGLICARYRDIPPIITNLMGVAFFLTPVIWKPEMLGRYQWVINLNPFYHFLEIVRSPLVGAPVNVVAWAAALGMTVAGLAVTVALYSKYRGRIAYWI